ncbi:hypothetical protein [Marinobacter sp. SS13-12]|uniref:hypothetical protein n=1 Tax=Marinobacter sp. SS13-12 TaxID=3050451 RepID=UPI0025554352|nr:hypothetical protein [Marinobacter sp. SS13-12]MDK8465897.1 hypothetical protein [Marinobacter sp. SS13-12]
MSEEETGDKRGIVDALGELSWPKFFGLTIIVCAMIIGAFYFVVSGIIENERRSIISDANICKGTIAAVMGKPYHSSISSGGTNSFGITELSYVRPSDNTLWEFRCKISGDSVVWATKDGPWRTRNGDAEILWSYQPNRGELIIRQIFSDGSSSSKNFRGVRAR